MNICLALICVYSWNNGVGKDCPEVENWERRDKIKDYSWTIKMKGQEVKKEILKGSIKEYQEKD